MSKLINLNQVRKQRAKAQKKKRADENAVRFGRTKAEKDLDRTHKQKSDRNLDGHEIEE
ncbi:DUF4169 family protein [Ruegeria arenilitoris]|uniref:DUF4169 family protein n=1 Tax=Ruegeria arenilitoris TaxID=1173585 RepID=UPI00147DB0CA|nr:DUF4169 family protein [Ruegeria arenilitoris]